MKQTSDLNKWCRVQERFLRQHLTCLQEGLIRVHAVEDNRFVDTTDEIAASFRKQLAALEACMSEQN